MAQPPNPTPQSKETLRRFRRTYCNTQREAIKAKVPPFLIQYLRPAHAQPGILTGDRKPPLPCAGHLKSRSLVQRHPCNDQPPNYYHSRSYQICNFVDDTTNLRNSLVSYPVALVLNPSSVLAGQSDLNEFHYRRHLLFPASGRYCLGNCQLGRWNVHPIQLPRIHCLSDYHIDPPAGQLSLSYNFQQQHYFVISSRNAMKDLQIPQSYEPAQMEKIYQFGEINTRPTLVMTQQLLLHKLIAIFLMIHKQMNTLLLLLITIVASQCAHVLPIVRIDLDAAPETRWVGALNTVLNLHGFENSFGPAFAHHNASVFSHLPAEVFAICGNAIKKHFPVYAAELQGLANAFNRPDVTYNYLAAWAYFHELAHADVIKTPLRFQECTGVLVCGRDGVVLHGRNMDQEPASIRNFTLNMEIYQKGRMIGQAVDWYWFNAGFMTALKPGVVSLEENWRLGQIQLSDLLLRIESGVSSQIWLFREVLQNPSMNSFQVVVDYLQSVPTGCPMYNIVAGSGFGEGAIISRHHDYFELIIYLPRPGFLGAQVSTLVQTNYDHWKVDPEDDNRRTQAEKLLKALPMEDIVTPLGLYVIMDSWMIHNEDTVLTVLMNPSTSYFKAIGQNGVQPPPPESSG